MNSFFDSPKRGQKREYRFILQNPYTSILFYSCVFKIADKIFLADSQFFGSRLDTPLIELHIDKIVAVPIFPRLKNSKNQM